MSKVATDINQKAISQRNLARFRRTILIVDDDLNSVDTMSRWFEHEGYEVKATFNPLHGLTLAAEHGIDAAVVDIQMPDMNGHEFLRELIGLKSFPVIVLRRDEEFGVTDNADSLGASATVFKTAEMDGLKALIEKSITDHSSQR